LIAAVWSALSINRISVVPVLGAPTMNTGGTSNHFGMPAPRVAA